MDYHNLSKEELIKILESKGIHKKEYSISWNSNAIEIEASYHLKKLIRHYLQHQGILKYEKASKEYRLSYNHTPVSAEKIIDELIEFVSQQKEKIVNGAPSIMTELLNEGFMNDLYDD